MKRILTILFLVVIFGFSFVWADELRRGGAESGDDGQEAGYPEGGNVNISFTYIELRIDLDRWGGAYRIPNVTIPQGATINSAYASLAIYFSAYKYPVDSVACEDVDSATLILADPGYKNLSNRWDNRTDAVILWDDEVNAGASARDSTPNISSLIQEVVNRPSWKSGNALILLFKCTIVDNDSSYYETYSWDTDPQGNYGCSLFVDYTPAGVEPKRIMWRK